MGQTCLRDAKSLAAFRSRPEMRCRSLELWPLVLPSLQRDRPTRPQVLLSPWLWDGFFSISAVMPLPTGSSGEFLAFASLSTRSAAPGIQKAGLLDSAGCSNICLFLECRRRRPLCKRPARLPERLCGLQEGHLPPLSQYWVRSGHGALVSRGATC